MVAVLIYGRFETLTVAYVVAVAACVAGVVGAGSGDELGYDTVLGRVLCSWWRHRRSSSRRLRVGVHFSMFGLSVTCPTTSLGRVPRPQQKVRKAETKRCCSLAVAGETGIIVFTLRHRGRRAERAAIATSKGCSEAAGAPHVLPLFFESLTLGICCFSAPKGDGHKNAVFVFAWLC